MSDNEVTVYVVLIVACAIVACAFIHGVFNSNPPNEDETPVDD
jgi:hypothetical protein